MADGRKPYKTRGKAGVCGNCHHFALDETDFGLCHVDKAHAVGRHPSEPRCGAFIDFRHVPEAIANRGGTNARRLRLTAIRPGYAELFYGETPLGHVERIAANADALWIAYLSDRRLSRTSTRRSDAIEVLVRTAWRRGLVPKGLVEDA